MFSGVWNLEFGASFAQTPYIGTATDFTMSEYYDAPNEKQLRSLIRGTEAQPQPGGRILIKGLRLELFRENGERQATAEAPVCVYNTNTRTINSAGRLELRSGDGRFSTEGEGFLWQQATSTLTISNRVHTVIRDVAMSATRP